MLLFNLLLGAAYLLLFSCCCVTTTEAVTGGSGGGLRQAQQEEGDEEPISKAPPANITCQISIVHTLLAISESNETIISEEETVCFPLEDDGRPSLIEYSITLPNDIADEFKDQIEIGKLHVSVIGATLDHEDDVVVLQPDAQFTIVEGSPPPPAASLAAPAAPIGGIFAATSKVIGAEQKDSRDGTGVRTLIVFRINGASPDDEQVEKSAAEIHEALFGNGVSIKTQFEKCSVEQLTWQSKGVLDIYLPLPLSAYSSATKAKDAAMKVAKDSPSYKRMHGDQNLKDVAHNSMWIVPGYSFGGKGFIAGAATGGTTSLFANRWGSDLTTVIHELSHNLGRGHAGRRGNSYGDSSSNQGSGGGNAVSSTAPQMCFNAYENIQWGWYKRNTMHFDPRIHGNRMLKLTSFIDMRKKATRRRRTRNGNPVVIINLADEYYIQWNQAKDYNIGTGMKDRVTVVDTLSNGDTWIQAELGPEDKHFVTDSSSSSTSFNIDYCGSVTGSSSTPDVVYIGIGVGGVNACRDIPSPSGPRSPYW